MEFYFRPNIIIRDVDFLLITVTHEDKQRPEHTVKNGPNNSGVDHVVCSYPMSVNTSHSRTLINTTFKYFCETGKQLFIFCHYYHTG